MGRELVPATGVALAGEYGAVPGRRYGSGGGSYLLVDHHSCGGGSLCAGKCGGDLNSGEGAGTCPLLWWVLLELFGGEDGSY